MKVKTDWLWSAILVAITILALVIFLGIGIPSLEYNIAWLLLSLVFLGILGFLLLLRGHFHRWIVNGGKSKTISSGEIALFLSLIFSFTVMITVYFGFIYSMIGIVSSEGSIVNNTRTCFYFSVVTFTTLGYGDFRPSEQARLVAAVEAFLGYIILGLIIGATIYILPRIGKVSPKAPEKAK